MTTFAVSADIPPYEVLREMEGAKVAYFSADAKKIWGIIAPRSAWQETPEPQPIWASWEMRPVSFMPYDEIIDYKPLPMPCAQCGLEPCLEDDYLGANCRAWRQTWIDGGRVLFSCPYCRAQIWAEVKDYVSARHTCPGGWDLVRPDGSIHQTSNWSWL